MILVQNHLLRLNGSKMIFISFVTALIMSCSSTKDVPRSKRPVVIQSDPSDRKDKEEVEVLSMDTIRWVIESEDAYPPITGETKEDSPFGEIIKDQYQVALLIPFKLTSSNVDNFDPVNIKFAQFYSGLKMALSSDERVNVNIRTFETNRDINDIDAILRELEFLKPDLIIGPYETDALSKAAEFAKRNEIPLISPWKAANRVTQDNPFYLQIRPNVSAYYEAIVAHMTSYFDRRDIRIISNANGRERNMISFIQKINDEKSNLPIVQPLAEYQVHEDSLRSSESFVFKNAIESGAKVFFLPQFNVARDEEFLYECLRKLSAEKGDNEIYVYTMPLALNSEKVDLNIIKNIHLRICEYKFADERNPVIKKFKSDFYNNYGWLPTEDAHFGYDLMKFVQYGLQRYGKYFHYYLKETKVDLNQMTIKVAAYYDTNGEFAYLMNNHFYMIEFEDSHFKAKSVD